MRIALAHDSIDTDGGVETYLLSIIAELRRRGHQTTLVYYGKTSRPSPLREAADSSLGIEELGLERALQELDRWKPDVCFSHNMHPLEVDRAIAARWPLVKMLHGFFGTCVSGLKMHAWPAEQACARTFGPACLALYVPRRCGQLSPSAIFGGYRWATEQRALFPQYTSLIVASRFMEQEVARHAPAARIDVLPLFSTMGQGEMIEGERDTVLFGGRMTSLKGGHVLIRAAARASAMIGRPIRVVMAGDGPQKESWRALAGSLRLSIEMPGWLNGDRRASVYGRAILVVVPSMWPEPFGLIGLDAASLGKPAIAFDVGGIREWLHDGSTGLTVDPAEGEAGLAEALVQMLEQPDERARMGRAAFELSRRMSLGIHVERLETVLRRAAA
jgi:glycosyltransferase involved in cell wall biosynthesis